jgi:hypothetical protein
MKNIIAIVICACIVTFTYQLTAQENTEQAAKEILQAYKTKDVALLKKYATGIMIHVINDGFFESKDGKPLVEIANNWDGNIKEIRYTKGDFMGKTVLLANAYFSDNSDGSLNVVMLTSSDESEWKAFTLGIGDISKSEFEQCSEEIPSDDVNTTDVKDYDEFSIEMANGDIFKAPNPEKLNEFLKSLNDDNFFLILNYNDIFLQASTSEKGYIVQYSDDSGMFEAEAYFTFEMLTDIFQLYIDKNTTWKEKAKWQVM